MVDRFSWQRLVASDKGPKSSTRRHVLLTLSLHMDQTGGSCFPSERTVAVETGLSRRAVNTHLAGAADEGWIERGVRGQSGQGWRQYEYQATLPDGIAFEGGEPDSPRCLEGEEPRSPRHEKGGEPDDINVGNEVPTSITTRESTSPENFEMMKSRYKNPALIDQAFKAIASTRKSGKVADTVLLAQLKKWERYPIEQVEAGIKIYLDKDYAGQGKGEAYLLGIIRKGRNVSSNEISSKCRTPSWL